MIDEGVLASARSITNRVSHELTAARATDGCAALVELLSARCATITGFWADHERALLPLVQADADHRGAVAKLEDAAVRKRLGTTDPDEARALCTEYDAAAVVAQRRAEDLAAAQAKASGALLKISKYTSDADRDTARQIIESFTVGSLRGYHTELPATVNAAVAAWLPYFVVQAATEYATRASRRSQAAPPPVFLSGLKGLVGSYARRRAA